MFDHEHPVSSANFLVATAVHRPCAFALGVRQRLGTGGVGTNQNNHREVASGRRGGARLTGGPRSVDPQRFLGAFSEEARGGG
jgi:hypothetical protein